MPGLVDAPIVFHPNLDPTSTTTPSTTPTPAPTKTTTGLLVSSLPTICDQSRLRSLGVTFCAVPSFQPLPCDSNGSLLSRLNITSLCEPNPLNISMEDNDYAFYKNILDDPSFPYVEEIVQAITPTLLEHFVTDMNDVYVDDVFVVHYNTEQYDSRCPKHQDPSDITVNVCLERSEDLEGSQIVFYGSKRIRCVEPFEEKQEEDGFLIDTKLGCCSIHWGAHPHEVTPLKRGRRTNVIFTMAYKDAAKSEKDRICYADQQGSAER